MIMRGVIILWLAHGAAAVPYFSNEAVHGTAPDILSVGANDIPNSYVIKFKGHVNESSASNHYSWVQQTHDALELRKRSQFPLVNDVYRGLSHTYKIGSDFLGYSGHFDDTIIEIVRRHPDVSLFLSPTLISLSRI